MASHSKRVGVRISLATIIAIGVTGARRRMVAENTPESTEHQCSDKCIEELEEYVGELELERNVLKARVKQLEKENERLLGIARKLYYLLERSAYEYLLVDELKWWESLDLSGDQDGQ